jgi:tetratricopeptide (TPR) repeat protein
MVLTLTWIGSAIAAPAVLARRAFRQGHAAFHNRDYAKARRHLERAARYEPLREEAVCLMAEASLNDGRPSEALYALNTLLLEQDQLASSSSGSHAGGAAINGGGSGGGGGTGRRSARVRLLRGIAGCMLGRAAGARRELAAISKSQASVDELLAAAQACVLSGDAAGAQLLLEKLEAEALGGGLAARVKLVRAALYFRLSAWEKALDALPANDQCAPEDAVVVRQVRTILGQKLRPLAVAEV